MGRRPALSALRPRLDLLSGGHRHDPEPWDRARTNGVPQSLAERLCITLHLIGTIRKDLGWKTPFREFDSLLLEWSVFVGSWVKALIPVVEGDGQEKPVVPPGLDGRLVDVEFFRDFMKGQQAGFPQPVIATVEIVLAPDLLDHGTVERVTPSRDLATVVEDRGDLSVGMAVEQPVDLEHDLLRCLSHLPGRWWQR